MKIYIVATPIGNMEDITARALETLRSADLILCEDTRQTQKLLKRYDIDTPAMSYHHHSGPAKVNNIIDRLREGKTLALVSDAGTPGIADPGNELIKQLLEEFGNEIKIIPIPGASAIASALSICGFYTNNFQFLGFLPHKKGKETLLKKIADSDMTTIFYESPHRVMKTLEKMKELFNKKRQIVVCRELTKMYESIYRGNISEVIEELENDTVKGEFTIIVDKK